MTFITLAACLALTTFLAVILIGSAVSALLWRTAARRGNLPAGSKAAGLFLLRLLPSLAGAVIVAGVFAPAFCRFEPRVGGETAGPILVALAALGGLLIVRASLRAVRSWHATRGLLRRWLRGSTPVTLPGVTMPAHSVRCDFPVVSVVGVISPRLFISDRVLRECSPDELAAVASHERGHVAAGDNLKRLLVRLCPDVFSLLPFGRILEEQWHQASEDAADDYTVRSNARPVVLANALLRVARMAEATTVPWMPMASLYRGGPVERRVRRLLAMESRGDDGRRRDATRSCTPAAWVLLAQGAVLLPIGLAVAGMVRPDLLHTVHHFIEAVVETLS